MDDDRDADAQGPKVSSSGSDHARVVPGQQSQGVRSLPTTSNLPSSTFPTRFVQSSAGPCSGVVLGGGLVLAAPVDRLGEAVGGVVGHLVGDSDTLARVKSGPAASMPR